MSDEILLRLKFALQALASPVQIQVELFPSFVVKADELALEFDHWYRCAQDNNKFDSKQKEALQAIDFQLEKMSSQKNLWTELALQKASEWQEIRELAFSALRTFNWEPQKPPSFHAEYVRSKPR